MFLVKAYPSFHQSLVTSPASNSITVSTLKAWAEITDVEGQRMHDSSVWKRNFRSALRAKGFQIIMDNKNDEVNPRKVFRFPEGQREASAGRVGKRVRRETKRDAESRAAGKEGIQWADVRLRPAEPDNMLEFNERPSHCAQDQ